MKKCLIPGSFDPVHNGHISLIKQALKDYSKVYVCILVNPQKEATYTLESREAALKEALKEFKNVEVITFGGFTVDVCHYYHVTTIVRGFRDSLDLTYEKLLKDVYHRQAPDITFKLYKSEDSLKDYSSTSLKDLIDKNDPKVDEYISPDVRKLLVKKV